MVSVAAMPVEGAVIGDDGDGAGQTRRVVAGVDIGDGIQPRSGNSRRLDEPVRVSVPVAALNEPVMPFWLVKPSTSSPLT